MAPALHTTIVVAAAIAGRVLLPWLGVNRLVRCRRKSTPIANRQSNRVSAARCVVVTHSRSRAGRAITECPVVAHDP